MTDARKKELERIAEGWSRLGVLLSPLPYIGERVSDFCHQRAGKYYRLAFGPFGDEFYERITTLLEGFMELERT